MLKLDRDQNQTKLYWAIVSNHDILSLSNYINQLCCWLFLIYINDIDTNLFAKICKFANDTKIGRAVATEDEVQLLRDDFKI